MLTISNVYGHGYDEVQTRRLHSLGFEFRDPPSRFAGSQLLRFVDFPVGPALEFIEVEDESEYQDFVPTGMTPYCPGISLLVAQSSPATMAEFQHQYQEWGPNSLHVNYDETRGPDGPGWNYLNFDVPVVRDTFIYLSQPEDPKPVRKAAARHPNTANQVVGLVFNVEEGALIKLARLIGVEIAGGEADVGGVRILSSDAMAGELSLPEKRFPLAAIVVQAESIEFFRGMEGVEVFDYYAKPSVHVEMPDSSWDLIVTT